MTVVLIFGASGFIGRHVRRALAPTGTLHCPGRNELDLVGCEVAELAALLRATRPDVVINCAGRLTGGGYDLIRANTMVTAKLIEAVAAEAPGARLVRLGSAAEYGPVPPGHAVTERDRTSPVSEYGLSQLTATRLVELASAAGRVDGVVLRVFNPIGPGLPEESLLGRAAAQLRRGTVAGGPGSLALGPLDAYRDFVDVRDVASAVVAAATVRPLAERVFNVASGRAVSTRDAVRLLAEAAGFTGEIREDGAAPERSAAVPWICGDIRRAGRLLAWAPEYDLAGSVKAIWSGSAE
ncbi:NAD(P)-dependent oxidoreductase [Micromonospora sp. HM5-17]|jgi:nucleoside-diphosphate-sugar epimerase|uniref:NAD-dependent epimerase/dehydratase family protein n=1 Tax=Micromonospora sp. HM5-17 TaxID=2487710 RepID=UPI000F491D59|nr:NAD(P)-dependent oxidoreductase [Micromonospora sp. HM5-17]ROT33177.1 NAD(P)-dependent oxidoreductase [Micromonospora sp. HM5-17]